MQRTLTELGRRLLSFPVHPRLGRILVEGERRADFTVDLAEASQLLARAEPTD